VRQRPSLQELNPNVLLASRRWQQTLTDTSTDEPAPQRRRVVREPFVAIFKDLLVDPSVNLLVNPLIIQPFSFLSRLCPASSHTLRPLAACYTAYSALHFASTDGRFKPCYKKGDIILPPVCEPFLYLIYLLTGDDPLCYSFCTNIRAYNCALAFTFISYKKDARIDFFSGI
jgi:hypothetical protein